MTLAVLVPVLGAASETFVRRHVEGLAPEGTVVVTRRWAEAPAWSPDCPLLELDVLRDEWGGAREQDAVREFLRAHRVSVVLAEFLDVWLPFLETVRATGARLWAHGHGYDVSSRLRDSWWREQYRALATCDGVITMSEVSRRRLHSLGLPRIDVVPYGVDVPVAPPARAGRGGCRVLAVGRMVAKKSPVTTITAFEQAASTRPGMRLVYAGGGPLQAAAAAAAGPGVQLLGEVAPAVVPGLMVDADVFTQHSVLDPETGDEEGLPVAVLEAMAAGLPVVATRHAGIPEAVTESTGILVAEHDVAAAAEALGQLSDEPALRLRMGVAGWERARDLYSWPLERERLRELLEL